MEYNKLENEIITFLIKRFNMLNEFMRVTKLVNLTAMPGKFESEAEDYVFLIEKREKMLKEIELLNKKLELPEYNSVNSVNIAFAQEVKGIAAKTDALINEIIELDKSNNSKAKDIFQLLKNSIKDINNGKTINTAYLKDIDYATGGFYDYRS